MGPLRKNLGSRIPNAAASSNSANSNADVTLQSLAAAYQDLTARLSALEQLQLENARFRTNRRGPYGHPKIKCRCFFSWCPKWC
ncbi:hypothetical protein G6F26_013144 [Rhizopus arrhizus]|nr:hypothetical protein G6F26_013144 [Rhizopus arrhizus]KAG1059919.1 hypothetical protein G6F41_013181 [Rhizopus arrhizus]